MPTRRDLRAGARTSIPSALAVEVPRAHLDRILLEAARQRLTIVTAGPGWGKTTAVAAWARRRRECRGPAVAWLSLTPGDDSPSVFWDSVFHAVAVAVAGSGAVQDGHPLTVLSAAGGINEEVLGAFLRGLDTLPEPLLLILDDFHVISDAEVMTTLTELVSQQTNVHLMLLTRFDPPLPLHRLRLAGGLYEVSAADLAFDAEAVGVLAVFTESLDLTPGERDEVLARTEGWPTGVRLATMFLARAETDHSLEGFGGTDKSVADYLVREVLHRNSQEVRGFLLRTSVVELIAGDLADAIVPGGQGRARLEALERANQFIVSVNPERSVYRYHPLLRDLLSYTLKRDDPAGFRSAHVAASKWFRAHRYPVRALGHAIAAEDWPLAMDAFVDASPSVVGAQRFVLREHLRAIPFASLEPSAASELCAAALEFLSGHLHAIEFHVTEIRRLLAAGDHLTPVAMAFVENLACASARARGDEASVATTAAAALEQVALALPGPAADGNRTIATTQSAVACLRAGDIPAARALLSTVVREDPDGDVALSVLGARGHLAWCDLVDGDLDGAIARARHVLDDAAVRGWTSQMQMRFACLPLAMAHLIRGDAESAARAVTVGLAADTNGVEVWPTIGLYLAQASVAVSRHRPRAATAALHSAVTLLGNRSVTRALADTLTRVAAEVALLTGMTISIGDHEVVTAMTSTGWSTRARVALARGDLVAAASAAGRVHRRLDSPTLDDAVAAIEAGIVEALIALRQHRLTKAVSAMDEALALASPRCIVRPFLVTDYERVAQIVGAAPTTSTNAALRGIVLNAEGISRRADPVPPEPAPLLEPLTERELAVLAELPTMRTNEEIAQDFYVSVNTVKSHLKHLYRKLDVTNRREAVRRARELGMLS